MDNTTILTMPPEIQSAIVSYILRPSDLRSLCLTCKVVGAVATERLYKAVYLKIDERGCASSFSKVNHRGHPHIRSLTIDSPPMDDDDTVACNAAIRVVLQLIPRNILRQLKTASDLELERDTLTTLFTQQMALEQVSLSFPTFAFKGMELPIDVIACAINLHSLSAYFCEYDNEDVRPLEFYGKLIQNCRLLKCLEVRSKWDFGEDDLDLGEAGLDFRTRIAFENFFGHLKLGDTKDSYKSLSLEELHFRNLRLEHPDCPFRQVVQYENLTWLTFWRCRGAGTIFQHLTKAFGKAKAKLRGFTYYHNDEASKAPLNQLQLFLQSFSGLEYLAVEHTEHKEEEEDFDPACLSSHYGSLQHLLLGRQPFRHGFSEDSSVSLAELQKMVKMAPKLRQLALDFPRITLWDIEHDKHGTAKQYKRTIDAIAMLPKLEILHVLSLPEAEPMGPASRWCSNGFEQYYLKRELDPFANYLMRRMKSGDHRTKLSAICFGSGTSSSYVRTKGKEHTHTISRAFYVAEPSGNSSKAVRTNRSMMRYREPMLRMLLDGDVELGGEDIDMSSGGMGQFDALG